ncbi:MAG: HAD family hydrolase [Barnesiella sp.]
MCKTIAALFDLDGVIVDTEPQYTKFWEKIGNEHLPEQPDFSRAIKGNTLVQIYERYFPGQEKLRAEITEELYKFEQEMTFPFIPGAIEFITGVRENEAKVAVVTSSNDAKMANLYHQHPHFKELFDTIVTADRITKSKPDPESYLLAAHLLNTDIRNCYVFRRLLRRYSSRKCGPHESYRFIDDKFDRTTYWQIGRRYSGF